MTTLESDLRRIDAFAQTTFGKRLATSYKPLDYVLLQDDLNDPNALSDLITDLDTLKESLTGISLEHIGQYGILKSAFRQLGEDIRASLGARNSVIRTELAQAQAEVAGLEEQLANSKAQRQRELEEGAQSCRLDAASSPMALVNNIPWT
ncbi:hypothetical protein C8Q76DRAFT_692498 [Earliella scabrosa]|nr:hypothetical protein C8Q76DRAFT_692498 [Earliella scabrosa]